jgi:hypothetical protein
MKREGSLFREWWKYGKTYLKGYAMAGTVSLRIKKEGVAQCFI